MQLRLKKSGDKATYHKLLSSISFADVHQQLVNQRIAPEGAVQPKDTAGIKLEIKLALHEHIVDYIVEQDIVSVVANDTSTEDM